LYSGLERIWELVAEIIDGSKPSGENWHQRLLLQMVIEVPEVRPALITDGSYRELNELRGFRHVVRNVYALHLDPEKIKSLVEKVPNVYQRTKLELLAFADFLDENADA
jgi:hypothetical protein